MAKKKGYGLIHTQKDEKQVSKLKNEYVHAHARE